jgi:hypothetical protein
MYVHNNFIVRPIPSVFFPLSRVAYTVFIDVERGAVC